MLKSNNDYSMNREMNLVELNVDSSIAEKKKRIQIPRNITTVVIEKRKSANYTKNGKC